MLAGRYAESINRGADGYRIQNRTPHRLWTEGAVEELLDWEAWTRSASSEDIGCGLRRAQQPHTSHLDKVPAVELHNDATKDENGAKFHVNLCQKP